MTAIKNYIDTGSLEQHYFDMFNIELNHEVAELCRNYPEIKQELNLIEDTLAQLAQNHAITPNINLRAKILDLLDYTQSEVIDLNNLPPTSKYADYNQWLKAVEHLIPAEPFEDFFMQVLRQDDHIAQTLVVTKLNVPEEVHETIAESFFILKGQCACTVGKEIFTLHAGDYLDIPLRVNHDIKIRSPYVIAILQHQFLTPVSIGDIFIRTKTD